MSTTVAATTTIRTLIDLVANLHDRVKDRKAAAEISQIQALISQIQSLMATIQSENAALLSENLDLKKSISDLERIQSTPKTKSTEEFIEFKGVSFKRKPSGGFFDSPYCPTCNNAMWSTEKIFPFMCGKCSTASSFNQGELTSVFEEFLSEYS